jgi:phospholipid/cholesterol/gamma-HCH transport system permease protein
LITREPDYFEPPLNLFGGLGRRILLSCRNAGRGLLMLGEAFLQMRCVFSPRYRRQVMVQFYLTGIKSLGVVTIVAMFIGMILALQTGLALRRFGQEVLIGSTVSVVMVREMGPIMTGLIVAASVGSAIAAQMGTMTVAEEVAALEVMSINPVRFLVMPRLLALMIMMPLLVVYANVLGVVGGAIVGLTQLGVSFQAYFDNAIQYVENKDLYVGLFKSVLFGIIICTVACHQGFSATEGAVGVGRATRRTVVISFLSILIVGYMVTRLFYV